MQTVSICVRWMMVRRKENVFIGNSFPGAIRLLVSLRLPVCLCLCVTRRNEEKKCEGEHEECIRIFVCENVYPARRPSSQSHHVKRSRRLKETVYQNNLTVAIRSLINNRFSLLFVSSFVSVYSISSLKPIEHH